MKRFGTPNGGVLFVYDGLGTYVPTEGPVPLKARNFIERTIGLSKRDRTGTGPSAKPSNEAKSLVQKLKHFKATYCLSPLVFAFSSDNWFCYPVAAEIVSRFALGRSLVKELSGVGLFAFLDRQRIPYNVVTYRAYLNLLLASLCMSVHGASQASDISPDAFRCWLACFRTPDGLRWRDDLWGKRQVVVFQCLRELVLAFARFADDPNLALQSGQSRLSANGADTWEKFRANASSTVNQWISFFDDWTASASVNRSDTRQMLRILTDWSNDHFPDRSIAEIMVTQHRPQTFSERVKNWKPTNPSNVLRLASRFSQFVEEELRGMGVVEAIWPLVRTSEVERASKNKSNSGTASGGGEARSHPLPPELQDIVEEILVEGEQGWPGSCSLFYETYVDEKGRWKKIYCPVFTVFFRVMLKLPLRGVQLSRFDSGEGDSNTFVGDQLVWKVNTGPHANHWLRTEEASDEPARGYARQTGDPTGKVTGFYINTNKTGDPYTIPWEHPQLHRILWELRLWQEAHYPISAPLTPEQYVQKAEKLPDERISSLPTIFPLFRLPGGRRNHVPGSPPSWRRRDQAWQEIMAETERRWNERNPKRTITIVKRQTKTNQPHSAVYNLHGLRVAGLTRLFMSGVPIEILSKLVAGHAGIVMTLYYLKFKPADIHRILEQASTKSPLEAEQFMQDLRGWSLEQAKNRSAALHEDGIVAAVEMDEAHKLMHTNVTIGVCPWAGTRCWDGGPIDRVSKRGEGKEVVYYQPVEGGEKNCIMCRHFVSGPPFADELWLYGTSLLERFTQTTARIEEVDRSRQGVIARRNVASTEKERASLQQLGASLDIQRDALAAANVLTVTSIHRIERLLKLSDQIRKRNESNPSHGVDLIVQESAPVVEFVEATEFERCSILTAASRLYPMMHNGETEARRNAFLDRVMWEAGKEPLSFSPLSDDLKRFARDSLARLLMERLDRKETQAIVEGRIRLQDVGLLHEAEKITDPDLGAPVLLSTIEHDTPNKLLGSARKRK